MTELKHSLASIENWQVIVDLSDLEHQGYTDEDMPVVAGIIDNMVYSTLYPIVTNLLARLNSYQVPQLTKAEKYALAVSVGLPHTIDLKESDLARYRVSLKPSISPVFKLSPGVVAVYDESDKASPKCLGILAASPRFNLFGGSGKP